MEIPRRPAWDLDAISQWIKAEVEMRDRALAIEAQVVLTKAPRRFLANNDELPTTTISGPRICSLDVVSRRELMKSGFATRHEGEAEYR